MVSIEELDNINKLAESNDVLFHFNCLLNRLKVPKVIIPNLHNTDNIILSSIQAIQKKDKEMFSQNLKTLSQWSPSSKSGWVFNDVLIFVLLLGCKHFDENTDTIRGALKERKSDVEEINNITNVFSFMLENDSFFSGKLAFISLVFNNILSCNIPANKYLSEVYFDIKNNRQNQKNNLFLMFLSQRAWELIIEYHPIDSNRIKFLDQFENKFISRVHVLSVFIYSLILTFFFLFASYLVYEIIKVPEQNRKAYNYYINFNNIFGFGGFVFLLNKNLIVGWISKTIKRLLGYPKLRKKDNN